MKLHNKNEEDSTLIESGDQSLKLSGKSGLKGIPKLSPEKIKGLKSKSVNINLADTKTDNVQTQNKTLKEINDFLKKAFDEHKISLDQMTHYHKLAVSHFTLVENTINDIEPGYLLFKDLLDKTFDELFSTDGLAILKKYKPDVYAQKYFEKFQKYPTSKKIN